MLLEFKKGLREAKWLWIVLAGSMLWGTGIRMFFKSVGKNKVIIKKINGEELDLKMLQSHMMREEIMRNQLRSWGMKIGPATEAEVMSNCEQELILNWLAKDSGVIVGDKMVVQAIRKQLGDYVFSEDGSVNEAVYKALIKRQGQNNIADFEEDVRMEQSRKILQELLKTLTPIQENVVVNQEERDFEYLILNNKKFFSQAKEEASEEQLKQYYLDNKTKYKDAGFVSLKLFEVHKKLVEENMEASAQEIEDFYEKNREKKYKNPKTYSIDFWLFSIDAKDNNQISKIEDFVSTIDAKQAEDFEGCKKLAKKQGLDLGIIRNTKIVLGKENYDKETDAQILSLSDKDVHSFSKASVIGNKIKMSRLVAKEGPSAKALAEVRAEIEETIVKRKAGYAVSKLTDTLLRRIRSAEKVDLEILEDLDDSNAVAFKKKKTGDVIIDTASGIAELMKKADELEKGKSGKISDNEREVIYFIDKVEKSRELEFDDVKEQVLRDFSATQAQKNLSSEIKIIKQSLFEDLSWPKDYQKDVKNISNKTEEQVSEVLDISKEQVKKAFGLSDEKQVLEQQLENGVLLIKLSKMPAVENKIVTDDERDFVDYLLVLLLENAKIEEVMDLSAGMGRSS